MKKFKTLLAVAFVAVAILMTSCNSCKREEDPTMTSLNFNEVVANDIAAMAGDSVYFFEAQVWFDGTVDTTTNLNVVKIMTVFQHKDTCTMIHHDLIDGKMVDSVETVNDYWLEDAVITNFDSVITMDSMIAALNASDCIKPASNLVVLRRPLCPPFASHPYYIFGTTNKYVTFDAVTGKFVE